MRQYLKRGLPRLGGTAMLLGAICLAMAVVLNTMQPVVSHAEGGAGGTWATTGEVPGLTVTRSVAWPDSGASAGSPVALVATGTFTPTATPAESLVEEPGTGVVEPVDTATPIPDMAADSNPKSLETATSSSADTAVAPTDTPAAAGTADPETPYMASSQVVILRDGQSEWPSAPAASEASLGSTGNESRSWDGQNAAQQALQDVTATPTSTPTATTTATGDPSASPTSTSTPDPNATATATPTATPTVVGLATLPTWTPVPTRAMPTVTPVVIISRPVSDPALPATGGLVAAGGISASQLLTYLGVALLNLGAALRLFGSGGKRRD